MSYRRRQECHTFIRWKLKSCYIIYSWYYTISYGITVLLNVLVIIQPFSINQKKLHVAARNVDNASRACLMFYNFYEHRDLFFVDFHRFFNETDKDWIEVKNFILFFQFTKIEKFCQFWWTNGRTNARMNFIHQILAQQTPGENLFPPIEFSNKIKK